MEFSLSHGRLRRWKSSDLTSLLKHGNDKEVSENLRDGFPYPYRKEDGIRWLAYTATEGEAYNWAIEVDGEAAGGIGYQPGEDVYRVGAEVGYWLGRAHWGRGIMTEAVHTLSTYLFEEFGFWRLEAPVFSRNNASARVLEKCGYVLEGRKKNAVHKRGAALDLLLYAKLSQP